MGFDVYHNPSAAYLGAVAYQGGRGEYNKFLTQTRLQRRQLDQRDQALRFEMQNAQDQRQFQVQRDKQLQDFRIREMEERDRLDRENFEYKYTATQKNRMKQIQQDIEEVENDEMLTPEQKRYAVGQLRGKMYGIQKMPVPKGDSPFPQGQGVGETWYDKHGNQMGRNSKGEQIILNKAPDWTQRYIDLSKSMKIPYETHSVGGITEWKERPATPQEVQLELERQKREFFLSIKPQGSPTAIGMPDGSVLFPGDPGYDQALQSGAGAPIPAGIPSAQHPMQSGGSSGDMPVGMQRRMFNEQFPLRVQDTPERMIIDRSQGVSAPQAARTPSQPTNVPEGAAGGTPAAAQQAPAQTTSSTGYFSTARREPPTSGALDRRTEEKLAKGETVKLGDWVGRVSSPEERVAKIEFRNSMSQPITRFLNASRDPQISDQARQMIRRGVQELLKLLKEGEYQMPANAFSHNPTWLKAHKPSAKGEAAYRRIMEITEILNDITQPPNPIFTE